MSRPKLYSLSLIGILLAAGGGAAIASCGGSSSDNPASNKDAGADAQNAKDATSSDGASATDGGGTGDGGLSCSLIGTKCKVGSDCCSKSCNMGGSTDGFGICAAQTSVCAAAGSACVVPTDCCTGACNSGVCGNTQCLSIGASCAVSGNSCCTGICGTDSKCQPVVAGATCVTAGNACPSGNADCCSGLCKGGVCSQNSSYCLQRNEICFTRDSCCSGVCKTPSGGEAGPGAPGTCVAPPNAPSGGGNCTGFDGELCPGGSCQSCCSRLCAPYAPTGVNVCQPAQGCRVEGNTCRTDTDCCGGGAVGSDLGAGKVHCSNRGTSDPIGYCTPPDSTGGGVCVPEGSICHSANYSCAVRADCCGTQSPRQSACILDALGVPRCNAVAVGGAPCVKTGAACAFSGDCCDKGQCLPNGPGGTLVCNATTCSPSGGVCTSDADCCPGLPCSAPPGSTHGTCSTVLSPPPPTTTPDGGTVDSGVGLVDGGGLTCALYGQSCKTVPCCNAPTVQCVSDVCVAPVPK